MASKFAERLRKPIAAVGLGVRSSATQLDASVPTITSGSGSPSATTEPAGSLYLDTSAADDAALYRYDGSAWIGGTGIRIATGTIATGDVATLNATPVELIAAQGAGKAVVVDYAQWMLDFESAAYDGASAGEDLAIKYTNGSGAKLTGDVDHSGFGDASADAFAFVRGVDSLVPVANAAVVAHILSGEWYAAAGDSPLRYRIVYRVVDLDLSA